MSADKGSEVRFSEIEVGLTKIQKVDDSRVFDISHDFGNSIVTASVIALSFLLIFFASIYTFYLLIAIIPLFLTYLLIIKIRREESIELENTMTIIYNNIRLEGKKSCSNCSKAIPINAPFCTFCGN